MPGMLVEWPLTYQAPPGFECHEASLMPKRQIAIEEGRPHLYSTIQENVFGYHYPGCRN